MTPTFLGRIQTRLFLLLVIAVPWTALIAPVLPGQIGPTYRAAYAAVFCVGLFGIAWEALYHGLQQFRWEKDWPILLGLLVGINEGLLVYVALEAGFLGVGPLNTTTFLIHFTTVWVLVWVMANGPMRIVFIRWRFRGGRIV